MKLKQIVSTIFSKELNNYQKSSDLIETTNKKLVEDGYLPQINPSRTNIFLKENDERCLIQADSDGFKLKGSDSKFKTTELLEILEDSPDRFIPNVVMRPLIQDSLCPTAVYVAGPSEIAYFAQFKTLYEFFDIPMPIVYPRASITILERKIEKVTRKYDLSIIDLMTTKDELIEMIIKQKTDFDLDETFNLSRIKLNEIFNGLDSKLKSLDPVLLNALQQSRSKMEYQLSNLQQKAMGVVKQKQGTTVNQITKGVNNIFPQNSLQERKYNLVYFLVRYGNEFISTLDKEMEIAVFDHQIIPL